MYSQCPRCLARFRVTATTLRAAHGRARCGHCGHKFDVLERLSDEMPPASETTPSAADPAPGERSTVPPTLTAASLPDAEDDQAHVGNVDLSNVSEDIGPEDYHFSAEDIEKVFIDARDWQKQYGGSGVKPTTDAFDAEDSELEVDEPEGFEDITLEGLKVEIESDTGESTHLEAEFDYDEDAESDTTGENAATQLAEVNDEVDELDTTSRLRILREAPDTADPEDDADEDAETRFYRALIEGRDLPAPPTTAQAPALALVKSSPTPMRADLRRPATDSWSSTRRLGDEDEGLPDLELAPPPAPEQRRRTKWLALGSVLLVLALAAQIVHHFRQDIVRRPQAGEILRRVYEAIGLPLSPDWDLDAFELRQWGPTVDVAPGSPLTVRASLTNRAGHAQPYPLLRLTFEDRFGAAVARRDFSPSEYLKSPPQATRQLAAGETTEAELSVVAPGADAVGFRLDTCLREGAAQVRCAHGET